MAHDQCSRVHMNVAILKTFLAGNEHAIDIFGSKDMENISRCTFSVSYCLPLLMSTSWSVLEQISFHGIQIKHFTRTDVSQAITAYENVLHRPACQNHDKFMELGRAKNMGISGIISFDKYTEGITRRCGHEC